MVPVWMLSDKWLSILILMDFNTEILLFEDVLHFDL